MLDMPIDLENLLIHLINEFNESLIQAVYHNTEVSKLVDEYARSLEEIILATSIALRNSKNEVRVNNSLVKIQQVFKELSSQKLLTFAYFADLESYIKALGTSSNSRLKPSIKRFLTLSSEQVVEIAVESIEAPVFTGVRLSAFTKDLHLDEGENYPDSSLDLDFIAELFRLYSNIQQTYFHHIAKALFNFSKPLPENFIFEFVNNMTLLLIKIDLLLRNKSLTEENKTKILDQLAEFETKTKPLIPKLEVDFIRLREQCASIECVSKKEKKPTEIIPEVAVEAPNETESIKDDLTDTEARMELARVQRNNLMLGRLHGEQRMTLLPAPRRCVTPEDTNRIGNSRLELRTSC